MAYVTSRLDAWMLHRLSGTAVLALLPGGTATGLASIFNGTRPQGGAALPQFLEFYQAGAVVTNCLPLAKHGVLAQYYTKAWQTGDDTSQLAPLLDTVEAQFVTDGQYLDEVYGAYHFTVLAQDAESQQIGAQGGLLYSAGGYRWLIAAEAA